MLLENVCNFFYDLAVKTKSWDVGETKTLTYYYTAKRK